MTSRVVIEIGTAVIRGGVAGRHHPNFVIPVPESVSWNSPPTRLAYLELLSTLFLVNLQLRPKECQVVIVEKVSAPHLHRSNLLLTLLKDMQVHSVSMQIDLCMSLLASGSSTMTGLVVDIGEKETRLIAIALGRPILQTMRIIGIGVAHALEVFARCLVDHLELPSEAQPPTLAQSLFQKVASAHPDCVDMEISPHSSLGGKAFLLPARLRRTPLLALITGHALSPQGDSVELLHTHGIAKALIDCIMACNSDVRKECMSNIVFTGGGAAVSFLPDAICMEASRIARTGKEGGDSKCAYLAACINGLPRGVLQPAVTAAFCPTAMAWTGASLFATINSNRAKFLSLKDIVGERVPDWMSLCEEDWTFFSPIPVKMDLLQPHAGKDGPSSAPCR